jgi:hypothetical protein
MVLDRESMAHYERWCSTEQHAYEESHDKLDDDKVSEEDRLKGWWH